MEHFIIEVRDIVNGRYDLSYDFNDLATESSLKKRKYSNAFGNECYEDSRYGQRIDRDYFQKGGVGHGVCGGSLQRSYDIEEGAGTYKPEYSTRYDIEEGLKEEKKSHMETPYMKDPTETKEKNRWNKFIDYYSEMVEKIGSNILK